MALIEARGVSKTYYFDSTPFAALDGIDLKINQGEFIAIVGPSGSGKSTLMNLLGILDSPTQGEILLDGKNIGRLSENKKAELRNRKIGFIFQSFNLLARTSVLDNVLLPTTYSSNKNGVFDRAYEILEQVGLLNKARNLSSQLSGGEQQRVAIARALINDPAIIFADEPTGNLDSKIGQEILEIICQLNKDGKTIILVTHDRGLTKFAQKIVFLSDGKIVDIKIQKPARVK